MISLSAKEIGTDASNAPNPFFHPHTVTPARPNAQAATTANGYAGYSKTQPLPFPTKHAMSANSLSSPPTTRRREGGVDFRDILFFPVFATGGSSAATMASSKTSFNLYCVSAEHSTYLTAPSSLAILSPSSLRTGCIFCFANLSLTCGSSRRSVCVPTIKQGTPGQWWCTSGNHFSRTFSKEAGEVTEKQTRKTSV